MQSLEVVCGSARGVMDTASYMIALLESPARGARQAPGTSVTPTDFERLGGGRPVRAHPIQGRSLAGGASLMMRMLHWPAGKGSCKKWKTSIRVVDPDKGAEGLTLAEWALVNQVQLPALVKPGLKMVRAPTGPSPPRRHSASGSGGAGGLLVTPTRGAAAAAYHDPALLKRRVAYAEPSSVMPKRQALLLPGYSAPLGLAHGDSPGRSDLDLPSEEPHRQPRRPQGSGGGIAAWPLYTLSGSRDLLGQPLRSAAAAAASPARCEGAGGQQRRSPVSSATGPGEGGEAGQLPQGDPPVARLDSGEEVALGQLLHWVWLLGGCQRISRCGAWSLVAEHIGLQRGAGYKLQQLYVSELLHLEQEGVLTKHMLTQALPALGSMPPQPGPDQPGAGEAAQPPPAAGAAVQLQVAPLQLLPTMEAVATEQPAAEPAQPPEESHELPTADAVPVVA
jgi:hypothetical protein